MRELGRFLAAPIPSGLVASCLALAVGNGKSVSIFVFICLLHYVAQAVFGIAIRGFLKRKGLVTLAAYALGGLAMTSFPNVPYTLWAMTKPTNTIASALAYFALIALYGTLTGISYWALARPDRLLGKADI